MAAIELTAVYSGFDLFLALMVYLALAWSAGEYARALGGSFEAYLFGSLIATPIVGWLAIIRLQRRAATPTRIPRLYWLFLAANLSVYVVGAFSPENTLTITLTIPATVFSLSLLVALAGGSRFAWWLELIFAVVGAMVILAAGSDPWSRAMVACEFVALFSLLAPSVRKRLTPAPTGLRAAT